MISVMQMKRQAQGLAVSLIHALSPAFMFIHAEMA
jgi:hypothetical protein